MLNLKNPKGYDKISFEKQFKMEVILKNNDVAMNKMKIDEIKEIVRFQAKQLLVAESRFLQIKSAINNLGGRVEVLKEASVDESLRDYESVEISSIDTEEELSTDTTKMLKGFLEDQLSTCKEANKSAIVEALQTQSIVTYIIATRLAAVEDVLEEFIKMEN